MPYVFQWLEQSFERPVTYINQSSVNGPYSFLSFLPVINVQSEIGVAPEPMLPTLLLRATLLPTALPCLLIEAIAFPTVPL